MNNSNLKPFGSFWFLLSLLILILNDFYLKNTFHNEFTGKISDFTGIFSFSFFFFVLFPKYTRVITLCISVFFIWWKSPFSRILIDSWNSIGLFQIARVVDYSDLWALIMILPAYILFRKEKLVVYHFSPVIPMILCGFAFIATSTSKPEPISEQIADLAGNLTRKRYSLRYCSQIESSKANKILSNNDKLHKAQQIKSPSKIIKMIEKIIYREKLLETGNNEMLDFTFCRDEEGTFLRYSASDTESVIFRIDTIDMTYVSKKIGAISYTLDSTALKIIERYGGNGVRVDLEIQFSYNENFKQQLNELDLLLGQIDVLDKDSQYQVGSIFIKPISRDLLLDISKNTTIQSHLDSVIRDRKDGGRKPVNSVYIISRNLDKSLKFQQMLDVFKKFNLEVDYYYVEKCGLGKRNDSGPKNTIYCPYMVISFK